MITNQANINLNNQWSHLHQNSKGSKSNNTWTKNLIFNSKLVYLHLRGHIKSKTHKLLKILIIRHLKEKWKIDFNEINLKKINKNLLEDLPHTNKYFRIISKNSKIQEKKVKLYWEIPLTNLTCKSYTRKNKKEKNDYMGKIMKTNPLSWTVALEVTQSTRLPIVKELRNRAVQIWWVVEAWIVRNQRLFVQIEANCLSKRITVCTRN